MCYYDSDAAGRFSTFISYMYWSKKYNIRLQSVGWTERKNGNTQLTTSKWSLGTDFERKCFVHSITARQKQMDK